MAAVDEVSGRVTDIQTRNLGEVRKKSYRSFQPEDVIFAKITPCMENGKSAVVPEIPSGIGFGSTEFHVLRSKPGVEPRYIWHFVRQDRFRRQAREAMTGTVGQERVPPNFLADAHIPLPTHDEQRQIADLLDSALASCRSTDSHLESAHTAVKRFRQAVLAAACSGRLTADWREHNIVESAQEALSRIRSAERTKHGVRYVAPTMANPADLPEIPESWCWAALPELGEMGRGKSKHRPRDDPALYGGHISVYSNGRGF